MKRGLIVKTHFDAAHSLKDYDGKCSNLHGHTWKVEADFTYDDLGFNNMSADFGILKKIIAMYIPDHLYLNDYYEIDNPTAEFLAASLFFSISEEVRVSRLLGDIRLRKLTVYESDTCAAYVEE